MQYIEAPAMPPMIWKPAVFMAGGITGCNDWQKELVAKTENIKEGSIFNPRRAVFDINDQSAVRQQIQWEFQWLWQSSIITFWFPKASICPITLFELGVHLTRSRLAQVNTPHICIGIEPGYERTKDILFQKSFLAPDVPAVDSLNDLAEFIAKQVEIEAKD